MHGYDRAMPARLHRLTGRLGAEVAELTPAHLQALCDVRLPENVDLTTLQDALTEGFMQAFEFASGQLRERPDGPPSAGLSADSREGSA
jgi:hypothetical protein